jgi:hypothetical protein
MTPAFNVGELLSQGAIHADSEVAVAGYVWDRFEHRAIYESLPSSSRPEASSGIWLAGQLPARPATRGDGPLHGQRVVIVGTFHWQPKAGAGHFGAWPAWLGVRQITPTT